MEFALREPASHLPLPTACCPALRTDKEEGQANFVNPGIFILNAGADFDLTPKLKGLVNVNYLRFERTAPIELLLFESPIHNTIGLDYSLGFPVPAAAVREYFDYRRRFGALAGAGISRHLLRQDTVLAFCEHEISILKGNANSPMARLAHLRFG